MFGRRKLASTSDGILYLYRERGLLIQDSYIGSLQWPRTGTQRGMSGLCSKAAQKAPKKVFATSPAVAMSKVERVGQLYPLVFVQNRVKSPHEIHFALYNMFDHLAEKHANCPSRLNSWCYYG